MKRKALGKGLRSLIPEAPARAPAPTPEPEPEAAAKTEPKQPRTGLRQVDIDLIRPNRQQPREAFDEEALESLASSLKSRGVLQPVVLRPVEHGHYELVAGERRWRAAQRAGLHKIPAVVREVPDELLLETALIENIQRENLNPIEEARAFRTLIDELGLTQQEVARRVGKQRATVTNSLRLLTLAKAVQQMVRDGKVGMGHARALVSLEDRKVQREIATRVAKEGLSVRQVEAIVSRLIKGGASAKPLATPRRDPNVVAAEEALQKAIGSKVRIVQNKKEQGRLELHFFSGEELNRIYDMVLGAARRPADKKVGGE
jgi:ParB family chromosome partitioning protein